MKRTEPLITCWELFEMRTDGGTLLTDATIKNALLDLDGFCFSERTGVVMPVGKRLFLAPWKSILSNDKVEMDLDSIDRKKLFSLLEKDLAHWEDVQATKSISAAPSMDPKELKEASSVLHKVFGGRKTDELEIGSLAAFYSIESEETDLEHIKAKIRTVAKLSPNIFSVGAGGAPKVRRLQTATGKTTEQIAFNNTRGNGSAASNKEVMRFTSKVKALGFKNRNQFDSAKTAGAKTLQDLARWIKDNG